MQTKQKVKITYISPMYLIANAIRYSRHNHIKSDSWAIAEGIAPGFKPKCPKCDTYLIPDAYEYCSGEWICTKCDFYYTREYHIGPKDFDLIKRIGFHARHEAVLEHSEIVFDVKMTTKSLLEESTHRIGVSRVATSSRYALDIIDVEFDETRKDDVNELLEKHRQDILELLKKYKNENGKIKKADMDDIAMLLPQASLYTMQLSFNLRSLMHFLRLRTAPGAHYTIRNIAFQMIDELPEMWRELVFQDEGVKKNYEKRKNNGM